MSSGGVGRRRRWREAVGSSRARTCGCKEEKVEGTQTDIFHKHASQRSEAVSRLGVGTKKEKNINRNSLGLSSYKAVGLTTLYCIFSYLWFQGCIASTKHCVCVCADSCIHNVYYLKY